MSGMLFQVDIFLGMKKELTKWNTNVSFDFKRDIANKASKTKCNMILLIFGFY